MLLKLSRFVSHAYTTKVLALLIILFIILIGLNQWLVHTPALAHTAEGSGFNLSEWTLKLVEKINGQQHASSPYFSALLLFVFLSIATSIALPRQIAALVAGIHLGAFTGMVIATVATTLGCLITFSVARYLFSEKITQKYPSKLAKISQFLSEQTFLKAVIIRLLPLGSNFLTNIIAGVSKVSMSAYVSGSFVGFIPQMVIFSLAGSGLSLGAENELLASLALFVIALLLSAYLLYRQRRLAKENVVL
ncbi:MAG: VTT domain-containing protein [Colwellia sp.]